MSKLHLPTVHLPGTLDPQAAPNGATPKASYLRRSADAMNTIATYHKKFLTMKCQDIQNYAGGGPTVRVPWPFYFCSGENTTGVRVLAGIVDTDYGPAVSPNFDVTVFLAADGSAVATQNFSYNGRDAPSNSYEVPNRTHLVAMNLEGLDPNTEYYVLNEVNDGARLLFLSAWETANRHADDSVTGVVDPTKFIDGGPIYDEHVQDLLDAGDKHWRHGGCHYLSWSFDWSLPITISATSYTNVVDGSSTTYSANTPGATIASQYHGTQTTGAAGHEVKIAVKAERLTGAGNLSVQLTDGTNTIALAGITTGGVGDWYTGTGNIPSQIAKWDIQAKVSAGSFDLAAVCVFAYKT